MLGVMENIDLNILAKSWLYSYFNYFNRLLI